MGCGKELGRARVKVFYSGGASAANRGERRAGLVEQVTNAQTASRRDRIEERCQSKSGDSVLIFFGRIERRPSLAVVSVVHFELAVGSPLAELFEIANG